MPYLGKNPGLPLPTTKKIFFTPHTSTRDKAIRFVCPLSVVNMKNARSQLLGIWAIHICTRSKLKLAKKLASLIGVYKYHSFVGHAYLQNSCAFCSCAQLARLCTRVKVVNKFICTDAQYSAHIQCHVRGVCSSYFSITLRTLIVDAKP